MICGQNTLPVFTMMQGDEYYIPIEIKDENGELTDDRNFENIEVSIGNVSGTMLDGDVIYDPEHKVFLFRITQEDTLKRLGQRERVQVRVKTLSGDVVGVDVGEFQIIQSQSKQIL